MTRQHGPSELCRQTPETPLMPEIRHSSMPEPVPCPAGQGGRACGAQARSGCGRGWRRQWQRRRAAGEEAQAQKGQEAVGLLSWIVLLCLLVCCTGGQATLACMVGRLFRCRLPPSKGCTPTPHHDAAAVSLPWPPPVSLLGTAVAPGVQTRPLFAVWAAGMHDPGTPLPLHHGYPPKCRDSCILPLASRLQDLHCIHACSRAHPFFVVALSPPQPCSRQAPLRR